MTLSYKPLVDTYLELENLILQMLFLIAVTLNYDSDNHNYGY